MTNELPILSAIIVIMKIRLATAQDESQVIGLFEEFSNFLHPQTINPPPINNFESKKIFQEIINCDDTFVFCGR